MREYAAQLLGAVFEVIGGPVLVYFLLINSSYLLLMVCAALEFGRHLRRQEHTGRAEAVSHRLAPGVALIVPAYNEEVGIVSAVQSMLSLRHPRHEPSSSTTAPPTARSWRCAARSTSSASTRRCPRRSR